MLRNLKWARIALIALLAAGLLSGSLAWAKKPPKPPKPPPEPPPVDLPDITYVEIPLGSLGGVTSVGLGMNDSGDAVGISATATGDRHAFLWTTSTGMVDLNDLIDPTSGWILKYAWDINNNGQVVGDGFLSGEPRAFRFTPPGTVDGLGTFGGSTHAYAVNDSGDVTGVSVDSTGTARAYLFTDDDGLIDLGGLDPDQSYYGRDLNSLGTVTGSSYVEVKPTFKRIAYRYTSAGGMQSLGALDRKGWSEGEGINDFGDVVGDSAGRAFLYTDEEGMKDLGTLGGERSYADAINNLGEIVGSAQTADGTYHPFVLIPGYSMASLDDLVLSGGPLNPEPAYPLDINEAGEICGTRIGVDIKEAFLLVPVEP